MSNGRDAPNSSGFEVERDLIGARFGAGAAAPALELSEDQRTAREAYVERLASGAYVEEWRPCPTCGGRSFATIAERDRYAIPVGTCVCKGCGLIMTNPQLREPDLDDFYRTLYRRLYTASTYSIEDFFRKQQRIGKNIARFIEGRVTLDGASRVLEIGAGAGGTLEVLCRSGARGLGLDLDDEYLNYGRGRWLNLQNGGIDALDLQFRPDLVVYRHVMEHLANPVKELGAVARLGRRGATRIYIEVPNLFDYQGGPTRLRDDLLKAFQSAHLYYFSTAALENALHLTGFAVDVIDDRVRALARLSGDPRSGVKRPENWRDVVARLRRLAEEP